MSERVVWCAAQACRRPRPIGEMVAFWEVARPETVKYVCRPLDPPTGRPAGACFASAVPQGPAVAICLAAEAPHMPADHGGTHPRPTRDARVAQR